LPPRVRQLCRTFGFRCGEVTIRNTRTRWGSCSADDNLSLSLHLMKLPDELTDYILLHELCHTRHKNHGPAFYALLNQVTSGRHPQLLKALKAYTTRW
ncbi:MAG: M48 family metallopeptidase, partial [Alistipes sp.]|nr:M48 family metallopeptidase [Alistipes sp.]